jgi:hypothetical protein
MKRSTLIRNAAVGGLTLLGAMGAISGGIVACSSSSTTVEPTPPPADGGGPDSTKTPGTDAGKSTDSGVTDAPSGLADVGNCVSDSSLCNSCYSFPDAADALVPLNACTSAVGNCQPFTGSVPDGAP